MRVFVIGLLFSLILTACNSQPASQIDATLILRDSFSQESDSYVQGENIEFYLTATSKTENPVTIDFSNAQQYDFSVESINGDEIWRWSDNQIFSHSLTSVTFQPGESKKFTATWDQTLSNKKNISIGSYIAKGSLVDNSIISEYSFAIR